jgi:hypothetical protein
LKLLSEGLFVFFTQKAAGLNKYQATRWKIQSKAQLRSEEIASFIMKNNGMAIDRKQIILLNITDLLIIPYIKKIRKEYERIL